MTALQYRKSILTLESTPLDQLAAEHGTPLYVYSGRTIRDNFKAYQRAFGTGWPRGRKPLIAYSAKANTNGAILRMLQKMGAGLDVVSGGELHRGLRAGFAPEKIVFAGVGKTDAEIRDALRAGIGLFNVESLPEGERIAEIALSLKRTARVALRINPDIDARTHEYITTGRKENKFGINYDAAPEVFERLNALDGVDVVGVHAHIGSEILEPEPYAGAAEKLRVLIGELRERGAQLETLNFGGGAGIGYKEGEAPLDIEALAERVAPFAREMDLRLILEPGRSIVGKAGILLTRVTYVKRTTSKRFAIVDAAMNDLVRPSLYGAYHQILTVAETANTAPREEYDIVGGICESGDFLGKQRRLPAELAHGDLLAVLDAGAYGFAMASNYNSRPRPAEVLVRGRVAELIRKRERISTLVRDEVVPEDLQD